MFPAQLEKRMTQFGSGFSLQPHRGTMILTFGIIGIISCLPLSIAAWVMGSGDLKKMDAGQMDPAGRSNTNVGKILGMIGTLLAIVGCVGFLLFGGLAVVAAAVATPSLAPQ